MAKANPGIENLKPETRNPKSEITANSKLESRNLRQKSGGPAEAVRLAKSEFQNPQSAPRNPHSAGVSFCKHFGSCGGCSLQNLPYEEQLKRKEESLGNILSEVWSGGITIHPSPETRFYRNKMEFSFSRQVEGFSPNGEKEFFSRLGLKAKKRWDRALDLEECHLLSPEIPELIKSVARWAAGRRYPYYDLRTHRGFLRHLVVREGKNTGQKMVILMTGDGDMDAESFTDAVRSFYPASAICRGINAGLSDVAVTEKLQVLYGPGFITEKLNISSSPSSLSPSPCPLAPIPSPLSPALSERSESNGPRPLSLSFKISPFSFFQTNTKGTERLYSIVRGMISLIGPGAIIDLYGGAGGFSLSCSDLAEKCFCVESVSQSVEDGKTNAALNGISNVEFVCAKTEDYLSRLSRTPHSESAVILDPPRCGLHPRALEKLLEIKTPRVIYVSCNPAALAKDLKAMAQNYKIDSVEGLDLFPHTDHVETIVSLALK